MTDPVSEVETVVAEVETVITPDIPLLKSGGRVLFSCEKGVEDLLQALAKDPNNGLPNKMTGILMKYLTEGIERDFGRTWDKTPHALRGTSGNSSGDLTPKMKAPSKAYKNELIEKSHYDYYAKQVEDGEISREEATALMFKAIDEIKEYEEAGFVISKNKTAGVKRFDAAAEVNAKYDDEKDYYEFYKKSKLEIVIPNLIEYARKGENRGGKVQAFETQLKKSNFILQLLSHKGINTEDEFYKMLEKGKGEWLEKNDLINKHLVKSTILGAQKPRYICFEGKNKESGLMSLLLWDAGGKEAGSGGITAEYNE